MAGCPPSAFESIRAFAPPHSPRLIRFVWVRSIVWRVSRRSASHCARVLQTRVRCSIEPVSRWLRQIVWLGSAALEPLAGGLDEGSADTAVDASNAHNVQLAKAHAEAEAIRYQALMRIADRCVQVMGGNGVTDMTIVETVFREIRAFRIYDGPTEVHKWSLAKKLKRDWKAANH